MWCSTWPGERVAHLQRRGHVQAFYNVCQHRGVRLVDDHTGNTENFRCPYHSWRYGTDGDSDLCPASGRVSGGLAARRICLPKVRCEAALGFYWINLDPTPSRSTPF